MSEAQAREGWRLESAGIDLVPEHECQGRPVELFWVWLAANIGILGVVYGGIVTSFGLSFYQSLLAAAAGVLRAGDRKHVPARSDSAATG
jgi:purine-cytosine permease-like protein